MKKTINRRSFVKLFTGGLLGAGLLPMVGVGRQRGGSFPITPEQLKGFECDSTYGTATSGQETIEPTDWERVRLESDILDKRGDLAPMIGSVTEVNGCTVVRIEQGGNVSYFSELDNIDEKSFTDWADKENLHWDKLELDPGFETKSGRDAFEDWGVCDPQIRHDNLRDAMRKESLDHYFDRLALKI